MYHSNKDLFQHIFDEIRFVSEQVVMLNKAEFLESETAKRAFSRSLEIIGEAVKNLSQDLVLNNPQVAWRNVAGMRDKLIHGYFSVNYNLVWDAASNVLPKLKEQLDEIQKNQAQFFS